MSQHDKRGPSDLFVLVGLVALVLIVFGRSIYFDFIEFDDYLHVVDNPYFHPVTFHHVGELWLAPYKQYMPVTYSLWAGLAKVGELPTADEQGVKFNPYLFHLVNVLLHALNALLVWRILRRIIDDRWAVAAGAAVFAVHPLQVEAVAWVSSTKDLLSATFALAAVLLAIRFVSRREDGNRSGGSTWALYGLATLAFIASVLSKATGVVTPLLALLAVAPLVLSSRVRSAVSTVWPLVAWFVVLPPFLLVTRRHQEDAALLVWSPPWARLLEAVDAISFYCAKLLWPSGLGLDYGRTPRWVIDHATPSALWLLPASIAALLWWQRRRRPALVIGAVLFVAALGPVLGLVPFEYQLYSTVADRYAYLAMLGIGLMVAALVAHYERPARIVAGVVIAALAVVCGRQVGAWRNSTSVFEQTIAANPATIIGWDGLGVARQRSGDLPGAIAVFKRAVENDPHDLQTLNHLANALMRRDGNSPEAARAYAAVLREGARRVLLKYPNSPLAHRRLATALQLEGSLADAAAEFERSIREDPADPAARIEYGELLEITGSNKRAIEQYRAALSLRPGDAAITRRLDRAAVKLAPAAVTTTSRPSAD